MKENPATGIHHVTLITRHVQANVDFYVGFLGLRLVKRTGGYEDATQLHLFYGDEAGSPGSLVTFLVWEDGAPGRVGNGQVAEIAFAIPPESIGHWLTRALQFNVKVEGPKREFGETVLRLKDPDGVIVKLVGVDLPAAMPWGDPENAIRRLRAVTLLTDQGEATASFIERFGYRTGSVDGNIQRMISATDAVDVREATGYVPGIPGTGTADHVAFRALDVEAVESMERSLHRLNSSDVSVHDRKYFTSLYVREPADTLIEYATDGPGFLIDEDIGHLGEHLFVPPHDKARADDIRALLPHFALPGEPRLTLRDLPFIHRFNHPEKQSERTFVLLHGAGGDEADLMPFARRIDPTATLIGVRGRSTEQEQLRWFRHLSHKSFDQADIRSEAEAFEAFVGDIDVSYGVKSGETTFIGYSNGGNFLAAAMALYPGLIKRAILLRSIAVLDDLPEVDLSGVDVLLVNGADDPFRSDNGRLESWLKINNARLETHLLQTGHPLTAEDSALAKEWIDRVA